MRKELIPEQLKMVCIEIHRQYNTYIIMLAVFWYLVDITCSTMVAVVRPLWNGVSFFCFPLCHPCHLNVSMTLEACRHSFVFSAAHTPGRDDAIADAPFRFRLQEFRRLAPNADSLPLPIPPTLLSHLVPPA